MLIIGGLSSESKVCYWWFVFVGSSSTVTKVQRRELSVRCVRCGERMQMEVILALMKQLNQLQRKSRIF